MLAQFTCHQIADPLWKILPLPLKKETYLKEEKIITLSYIHAPYIDPLDVAL